MQTASGHIARFTEESAGSVSPPISRSKPQATRMPRRIPAWSESARATGLSVERMGLSSRGGHSWSTLRATSGTTVRVIRRDGWDVQRRTWGHRNLCRRRAPPGGSALPAAGWTPLRLQGLSNSGAQLTPRPSVSPAPVASAQRSKWPHHGGPAVRGRHRTAPGPVRSHHGHARAALGAPQMGRRGSTGRRLALERRARRGPGVGGITERQQRLSPVRSKGGRPDGTARICQERRLPRHRHHEPSH